MLFSWYYETNGLLIITEKRDNVIQLEPRLIDEFLAMRAGSNPYHGAVVQMFSDAMTRWAMIQTCFENWLRVWVSGEWHLLVTQSFS